MNFLSLMRFLQNLHFLIWELELKNHLKNLNIACDRWLVTDNNSVVTDWMGCILHTPDIYSTYRIAESFVYTTLHVGAHWVYTWCQHLNLVLLRIYLEVDTVLRGSGLCPRLDICMNPSPHPPSPGILSQWGCLYISTIRKWQVHHLYCYHSVVMSFRQLSVDQQRQASLEKKYQT